MGFSSITQVQKYLCMFFNVNFKEVTCDSGWILFDDFLYYALLKNIDFYFETFFFPIIFYLNIINEDCQFFQNYFFSRIASFSTSC